MRLDRSRPAPPQGRRPRFEPLEDRLAPAVLVAAYAFNEGSGTTVADASGTGNNGATSNTTWNASGKYGAALSFNGTSALVNIPDSASLDITAGITLEAWVRPTTVTAAWRDVIYKGTDVYYLEATSSVAGRPAGGAIVAGSNLEAYGTSTLAVNTWSHLAVTYDGATMRLYVNGSQVSSSARNGTIATSNSPLQIGGDSVFGQYFSGLIDEVRIYNGARSAAEVVTDMNTAIGGGGPSDTTPPTVSITAPSPGAAVSSVVQITATASDNIGVTGVEFLVDGNSLGIDPSQPYSMSWDSTTATNGQHSLTAIARDAASNSTTSTAVLVTSSNAGFVNETIIPGITYATTIAFLPDNRMLIGELTNKLSIVQPGSTTPTQILDLGYSGLIGEQGLMDVAIDPNFNTNHFIYIFYTKGYAGGQNKDTMSRFTMSGNTIVAGSEFFMWQDDIVSEQEHHAGAIAFGNDGKIYFTVGDHFIPTNSQNLNNYRGKVLRLNMDGTVPTDNPFYDGAGPHKDAIWAYGLRNPYRMSIDPVSGKMYIGDVGGNTASTAWEELNVGAAGANYGWSLEEGYGGGAGITQPLYAYPHSGRDACVTAGFIYRGTQFPVQYQGSLFFGDYAQKWIKRVTFDTSGNMTGVVNFMPTNGAPDTDQVGDIVKMIPGPDGSIYYVDLGFNGNHVPNAASIRRIRYVGSNQPPSAVASGDPTSGTFPLPVNFSSAGSIDPEGTPLTYSWDFGDGGTSTDANPSHTYAAAGSYTARLTTSDGVNFTLSNDVVITVGTRPVPTILGPAEGSFFRAGDIINYSGSATDAEDGTLGASAFSWTILFHHESHIHPAGGPFTDTTTGQLTIPTTGHDYQGATSYEIQLTVTDSTGLTGTTSVTVFPDKVDLTFDTVPSGLTLSIDGINKTTPFVLDDLIGFQHTIAAPPQSFSGTTYAFESWSDAGASSHSIVVPATDQSYTAKFHAMNAALAGRSLFYKGSPKWNVTSNNLPGFSDDNAIATDKTAYLPGSGPSTFANVSSFLGGINGIMVDLTGSHGAITANDFIFNVGNNNSPGLWSTAAAPTLATVRGGAGAGGSDRVELLWADGAVRNTWLQVIVRGNDALGGSNVNLGLAASDVFYFGSAPADTGSGNSTGYLVNSSDETSVRNDPHSAFNPAAITNPHDINRDGQVNSSDQTLVRNFSTSAFNQLTFIDVGAGGPFAPAAEIAAGLSLSALADVRGTAGDAGIASTLAALSAVRHGLFSPQHAPLPPRPPLLRDALEAYFHQVALADLPPLSAAGRAADGDFDLVPAPDDSEDTRFDDALQ